MQRKLRYTSHMLLFIWTGCEHANNSWFFQVWSQISGGTVGGMHPQQALLKLLLHNPHFTLLSIMIVLSLMTLFYIYIKERLRRYAQFDRAHDDIDEGTSCHTISEQISFAFSQVINRFLLSPRKSFGFVSFWKRRAWHSRTSFPGAHCFLCPPKMLIMHADWWRRCVWREILCFGNVTA